uniref:BTB domain-containing protein n=1 Tax=Panagrolaimus sp. ES5 TaxID=591445 RepID=A0AC34G717_9BILA
MVKTELPFSVKWKIKEINLLAIRYQEGEKFKSKRFSITPDSKYFLSIYPKRNATEAYIFINVEIGNRKEIECRAKISVETAGICKDFHHIYPKSMGHGLEYCFTHQLFDSAKKFIVDGEMTIKVEGIFKFDEVVSLNESLNSSKAKKPKPVGELMWDRSDKDFTIVVDKKEIKIHKHILGVQSPVFEGMFNSGMKEAQNNKVEIPNYSFEAVEIIVKLCYDMDVSGDKIVEHCIQLYEFVDQYQMATIQDKIELYLTQKVSPSNVCSLAHSATSLKNSRLSEYCYDYLLKCMKETTAVADLDLLDKETAIKLLKNVFTKDI